MHNRTNSYPCQELTVPSVLSTIEPMVTNDIKKDFSKRLNKVLDHEGIPIKGKGRQGVLAKMFSVSDKGARKWIEAESIPSTTKTLPAIAKKFNVTAEWLLTGDPNYAPSWVVHENGIRETNDPYKNRKKLEVTETPLIKWQQIRDIIDSNHSQKEFKFMPYIKGKVHRDAFVLEIEGNEYSPYLVDGDAIMVNPPGKTTLGQRVLIELNGQFHIMDHVSLEKEYFLPKKSGNTYPIAITDDLKYKIIGVLSTIHSTRIA